MKNNILLYTLLLFLNVVLFVGCEKEEDINTVGLKVYLNTEIPPVNESRFTVVHTPTGSVLRGADLKFPIKTTRKSLADITAELTVNNLLVDEYNERNGTNYEVASESSINITGSIQTIKAGSIISTDSVVIELNSLESLKSESGYLLPLQISKIETSDLGAQISSNMSIIYLFIKSEFNNVDVNAASVEGELIKKTGWKSTAVGTYASSYLAENAIDDKFNTSWFYTVSAKPSITIDMQTVQTVKGVRLAPNYNAFSSNYAFKKVEVETSKDDETWTKQGVSANFNRPSGNANSPDFKIIKFYSPIDARYLRLNMIENYEAWGGIGEIDVYK